MLLRLRQRGNQSLIHGLRGRPSNRELPARLERKILAWLQQRYADFGPTLAAEHLARTISRCSQWLGRQIRDSFGGHYVATYTFS